MRKFATRVCCMERYSTFCSGGGFISESRLKAKKSMTCLPCVLIILMDWPFLSGTALPLRASTIPLVLVASVICFDLIKETFGRGAWIGGVGYHTVS